MQLIFPEIKGWLLNKLVFLQAVEDKIFYFLRHDLVPGLLDILFNQEFEFYVIFNISLRGETV